MKNIIKQSGQGLTEYLILVLLISVVSIAAAKSLGKTIKTKLETVKRQIHSEVVIKDKDD